MKIELKKERNPKGEIRYFTYVDGTCISTSCAFTIEDAEKEYEKIKNELKNPTPKEEILKSEEI